MEFLQTLFGQVDSLTWGWALIPILVVFGVFITIVVCSCTAFIILLGDVYVPGAEGVDGVVLPSNRSRAILASGRARR